MAYENRPNTGSLWPNKNRTQDIQPNTTGKIYIDRSLLEEVMAQSNNPLVQLDISGWTAIWKAENVKYISLKISKPFVKGEQAAPQKQQEDDDDSEIPF